MPLPSPKPDDRILRLPAVRARTGLSRSMIYRKMAESSFPPSIKLNARSIGWHESQVQRWIENPIACACELQSTQC